MSNFTQSIYQLIVKTSTTLPNDVENALEKARNEEIFGTRSKMSLDIIDENNFMAQSLKSPICQDTGMPTFYIKTPVATNQIEIKKAVENAVVLATKNAILRPNAVDSLSGKNSGDNLGRYVPVIYFEQWEADFIDVRLILKGGGCENKNMQYSLPMEIEGLGRADRGLEGVRKCILHAVFSAQGQGCGPGFLGVAIGGDRASGYAHAKKQLLRKVNDKNNDNMLADLEEFILNQSQELGIGTLGFGGKTTLLGCKIGAIHRLPASYFISIAYMCWAYRRMGVKIDQQTGEIFDWTYEQNENPVDKTISTDMKQEIKKISTPVTDEMVRELRVGDIVQITGIIYTGRDEVHKWLFDSNESPTSLQGQILYHCGPVMKKNSNGSYKVLAAGPTTSMREEPYQADIIKKYGVKAVIGKGGMGNNTLAALKECGAVYLNAIGGAAQYYAKTVSKVGGVHFLEEFGVPEAMWTLDVNNFTAIVTMDSYGESLHKQVEMDSFKRLCSLKNASFQWK